MFCEEALRAGLTASHEVFKIGLKGLYSTNVRTDTAAPLIRFRGATQKATKVNTSVTFALSAVPIPISASRGIPNITAKVGSRYTALKSVPKIVITIVPTVHPITAVVFFFLAW